MSFRKTQLDGMLISTLTTMAKYYFLAKITDNLDSGYSSEVIGEPKFYGNGVTFQNARDDLEQQLYQYAKEWHPFDNKHIEMDAKELSHDPYTYYSIIMIPINEYKRTV